MSSVMIHRYGNPGAGTVVLVHGLTEAGTTWPDLVEHWGPRWEIVAPDLRGHGRSPRFTQEELAAPPDVMLADVVEVVASQPQPVALIGHSLGGLLALRTALLHPDWVWALVLEDPARPGGDIPDPVFVAEIEGFLDAMADADAAVARMRDETTWSGAEIAAWAQCKSRVDRAYIRGGLYLGDCAWEELFDALTVPTLLLVPPDSQMAPRPKALHNSLVRTVVVPDSGHCVRRDQPAAYFRAVDTFLAEVAPATTEPDQNDHR